MKRLLLAGAAAFAFVSGPALAQSSYSQSTTTVQSTVTPEAPSADSTYKSTKSRTFNSDGSETVQSKSFSESRGGGVSESEHVRTVGPDGRELNSSETSRTTTPGVGETTTRSTTTTIDR